MLASLACGCVERRPEGGTDEELWLLLGKRIVHAARAVGWQSAHVWMREGFAWDLRWELCR